LKAFCPLLSAPGRSSFEGANICFPANVGSIDANNQQRGEHLKWDAVTEAGGVVASDEARLALNVLLVKE